MFFRINKMKIIIAKNVKKYFKTSNKYQFSNKIMIYNKNKKQNK